MMKRLVVSVSESRLLEEVSWVLLGGDLALAGGDILAPARPTTPLAVMTRWLSLLSRFAACWMPWVLLLRKPHFAAALARRRGLCGCTAAGKSCRLMVPWRS